MLDHTNVANLQHLDCHVLCQIVGGATISGTMINSITSALRLILDLGRSLGTAIKRMVKKKTCSA